MFELARRVERIDVDGDEAGAQHGRGGDGVLQHVRHHDGDAVAAGKSGALQPRGQRARQLVDLPIGQVFVHADVRMAVAEFREACLEQRDDRRILGDVDVGRHAGRVALQPEAIHGPPPRI